MDHEEQKRECDNPGFSRLLELLHGSYLKRGVRSSVASKLEQVDVHVHVLTLWCLS